MNIFTQKAKLLKEIKSQQEKIQELKSENKSLKDDVSDLKDSNTEMNKEIKRYKRKYINTHIECDRCYTTLQEDFIYCPKCGKKAEVYSRITGYYRPVQNWNDGKTQEYKNRTLYDITHSQLKKVHTSMMTMKGDEVEIQPVASHKYLFTTSTCPNCRMAKKMLEGEELEIIDAEQNPELVKQYGIRQAPTLVITDGAQVKKYVNASNIQKYVDEELD